jgi:hypothetical protein
MFLSLRTRHGGSSVWGVLRSNPLEKILCVPFVFFKLENCRSFLRCKDKEVIVRVSRCFRKRFAILRDNVPVKEWGEYVHGCAFPLLVFPLINWGGWKVSAEIQIGKAISAIYCEISQGDFAFWNYFYDSTIFMKSYSFLYELV